MPSGWKKVGTHTGRGWGGVPYRLVPLPVVAHTPTSAAAAAAAAATASVWFRTLVPSRVVEPIRGDCKR